MMQRGIFFAGILYAVCGVLNAFAASSVRNLGVGNTYSSASVAADAAASNASSTTTSANLRGGSVRVTAGTSQTGTATNVDNSTRVITTPRLSIGQYLGGGTSISGGSSIRPQTPNTGGSSSGGSVGTDPGLAGDLREDIEKVREELYQETDTLREADRLLEEEKQNNLVPVDGGYIILDDRTNEISIDVENLKDAIGGVVGKDGREIELGIQGDYIAWRYVGDDAWTALIAIADITGPQGPQGEMGPQGPQGEPGDPADVDLSGYPTFDEMNAAIAGAVAGVADLYATKEYVDTAVSNATAGLATNEDVVRGLAGKVDANATIIAGTGTKITYDEKGLVTGSANLEVADLPDAIPTSKIDGLDTALAGKAEVSALDAKENSANKADTATATTELNKTSEELFPTVAATYKIAQDEAAAATADIDADISTLEGRVTTAEGDIDALEAGMADKASQADVTALTGRVTANETSIGEINASVDAINTKVGEGSLQTTAQTIVSAINELKTKTDSAPTEGNLQEINNKITTIEGNITNITAGVETKADKATTLAGYGITDAYTQTQTDAKIIELAVPQPTEDCIAESGLCVLSVGTDGQFKWLNVTSPAE